jgi:hypothetical protein
MSHPTWIVWRITKDYVATKADQRGQCHTQRGESGGSQRTMSQPRQINVGNVAPNVHIVCKITMDYVTTKADQRGQCRTQRSYSL